MCMREKEAGSKSGDTARAPLFPARVVNPCLEHVRYPHHVMRESLEHIKPNGHAYFTPPVGHGCDSPAHLHHFTSEQDLRARAENHQHTSEIILFPHIPRA